MKKLLGNQFRSKIHKTRNGYVIKYTNLFGLFWLTIDKCFIDSEGLPYMDEWIFETEEDALASLVNFKNMNDVGRHWNTEILFFTEHEKK